MKPLVYHAHGRTKEQLERMEASDTNRVCIFCPKGLATIHRLPILKSAPTAVLTNNAFPYSGTKRHLLVIPKRHREQIDTLTAAEWKDIGSLVRYAVKKYTIRGCSVFIRCGTMSKTGATIQHLHIQLVEANASSKTKNAVPFKVKLGYQKP